MQRGCQLNTKSWQSAGDRETRIPQMPQTLRQRSLVKLLPDGLGELVRHPSEQDRIARRVNKTNP